MFANIFNAVKCVAATTQTALMVVWVAGAVSGAVKGFNAGRKEGMKQAAWGILQGSYDGINENFHAIADFTVDGAYAVKDKAVELVHRINGRKSEQAVA